MRWLIALAWSALLTVLLLQAEANPVIDLGLPRGDNTLARELAFSSLHLLAFCVTCLCWFWALISRFHFRSSLRAALIIAIALGLSTEFMQTTTLDRHFSWLDLAANIAGALIAARLVVQRYTSVPLGPGS